MTCLVTGHLKSEGGRAGSGDPTLPKSGSAFVLSQIIQKRGDLPFVISQTIGVVKQKGIRSTDEEALLYGLGYLEGMLRAGWVKGAHDPSLGMLKYELPRLTHGIKMNQDTFV